MVDQLILLLTTDWFSPHWNTLGVDVDESTKKLIQMGCREITKQILDGATNYYQISFTTERIEKTRSMLRSLIGTSETNRSLHDILEYWDQLSDEDEKAAWIWNGLTSDLVSSKVEVREPRLDPAISEIVLAEYLSYEIDGYEFGEICEGSPSPWDGYTRSLTPEQPTALADTLASVLCTRRFEFFWHAVQRRLTPEQTDDFVAWYRNLSRARGRREVVPRCAR